MVKKRVKENSEKVKDNKPKKNILQWVIIGAILIVVIVILVLLLKSPERVSECEKNNLTCYTGSCPQGYHSSSSNCFKGEVCCEKDVVESACESYGNICRNNSCPSNTMKIEMACDQKTEVCCRNISTYKSPCENQKNVCFKTTPLEPDCPDGYGQVDLGCILGEICCKKILNACEIRDYTCKESCNSLEEKAEFACGTGEVCCRYKINTKDECEKADYQCQYSSCKSGFEKAGICDEDDLCCRVDTNPNRTFIYGFVNLKQGNCMPLANDSSCRTDPLDTTVAIFMPVSQLDMDGLYYMPSIEPIESQETIKNGITGYYEIALTSGTYSIFAKDPLGNSDYYCNQFNTDGNACTFTMANASFRLDFIIDHATY